MNVEIKSPCTTWTKRSADELISLIDNYIEAGEALFYQFDQAGSPAKSLGINAFTDSDFKWIEHSMDEFMKSNHKMDLLRSSLESYIEAKWTKSASS